jgi:hypothetical protein
VIFDSDQYNYFVFLKTIIISIGKALTELRLTDLLGILTSMT